MNWRSITGSCYCSWQAQLRWTYSSLLAFLHFHRLAITSRLSQHGLLTATSTHLKCSQPFIAHLKRWTRAVGSQSSLRLAQYRWILPVDKHSVDRDRLTFHSISDCFNVVQSQIYVFCLVFPEVNSERGFIETASVAPRLQHEANLTYKLTDSFSVNFKDIKGFRNKKTSNKPSTTSQGGRRSAGTDSRQLGEEDRRINDINREVRGHTLTAAAGQLFGMAVS